MRKCSADALIVEIDTRREHINRSSVIRVFVLDFSKKKPRSSQGGGNRKPLTDTREAMKARAAALFRELVAQDHRDALTGE